MRAVCVGSIHAVELLYAYVYSKLLYNGSWGNETEDAADVTKCVLTLSAVLSDPAVAAATLDTTRDSVQLLCILPTEPRVLRLSHAGGAQVNSALQRSLDPLVHDSTQFSISALQNVADLLR